MSEELYFYKNGFMKKILISLIVYIGFAQAAAPDELFRIARIEWGVSERQGDRDEMEDDYAAVTNLKGHSDQAFFGIYDGHCGAQAAIAAAKGLDLGNGKQIPALHELVDPESEDRLENYKHAYEQTDENISAHFDKDGTTAVTARILKEISRLDLAWAGDSRGVLVKQDGAVCALGTTDDHKPGSESEKLRIKAVGGFVMYDAWGPPRVGGLSVSRTLGDKKKKASYAGIIAEPDVEVVDLQPEHAFLILACDGVWDVLQNEVAAYIVARALKQKMDELPADPIKETQESVTEDGNSNSAMYAARALRDEAYNELSQDNISVIVVKFCWAKGGKARVRREREDFEYECRLS